LSSAHRYRRPILLLAALALLVPAGFLYSPWHKHDPRTICPFSGVEHTVVDQPDAGVIPAQQSTCLWTLPDEAVSAGLVLCGETRGPRAPPIGPVVF
jgi:hypothetical protein